MVAYYRTVQIMLLWNVYVPYTRQIMLVKKKFNFLWNFKLWAWTLCSCISSAILGRSLWWIKPILINLALHWNFLQIPTANQDLFGGKGNRWFNLQDWRWVRQCRAAFPEGSVPRRACPGTEAFPMPRSHWHEHRYVAAAWAPKHESCWESGSPHQQCPPNVHNREARQLL